MDSIEITLMIVVGAAFCYWIIEMMVGGCMTIQDKG